MKIPLITLLLSAVLCFALQASEDLYAFETEEQKALYSELTYELRCPKCLNQSIADSNAMIASDIKDKVSELIIKGKDRNYIIQFMKQRYGDFVHYVPPTNMVTSLLWFIPLVFAMTIASILLRKSSFGT